MLAAKADDLKENIEEVRESLAARQEAARRLRQDLRAQYDFLRAQRLPGLKRLSHAYPALKLMDKKELFDKLHDFHDFCRDTSDASDPKDQNASHRS